MCQSKFRVSWGHPYAKQDEPAQERGRGLPRLLRTIDWDGDPGRWWPRARDMRGHTIPLVEKRWPRGHQKPYPTTLHWWNLPGAQRTNQSALRWLWRPQARAMRPCDVEHTESQRRSRPACLHEKTCHLSTLQTHSLGLWADVGCKTRHTQAGPPTRLQESSRLRDFQFPPLEQVVSLQANAPLPTAYG